MQKRYCVCGHLVLVRYLPQNGLWRTLFLSPQRLPRQKKIHVSVCPNCGLPLDIHTLR